MNWRSYEETVKEIYAVLGKSAGVEIEGWGPTCKVRGKSGVDHQVDVLTTFSDGIHKYRTAIECKYWNKKVPKDVISKLVSIVEDASIDKGVVVSRMGFTADATTYAEFMNIGLVELRKPADKDWDGKIKNIHFSIHFSAHRPYNFEIIQKLDFTAREKRNVELTISTDRTFVETPGTHPMSLLELINAELKDHPDEGQHHLEFAAGTLLSVPDEQINVHIEAIRFMVAHETSETQFDIYGEDLVFMIMESLFEGRRFIIAPDGTVRQVESD